MITITRSFAHQARIIIARALFGAGRPDTATLPVQLVTCPEALCLRAYSSWAAVEYRTQDGQEPAELTVPLGLFADCEGRKADPVHLEHGEGQVLARWQDGPVPQVVSHQIPDLTPEFPELPAELAENPPELLSCLVQAMDTTDPDTGRFALNTVQLRGRSGVVAATDGRQLLRHSGFAFPWDGDILLPKTPLFACKELPHDQPVLLGSLDDWLCLRVGPWTIWLAIDKTSRFPKVETCCGRRKPPRRRFRSALPMPSSCSSHCSDCRIAVTVDLNGRVAIRARPAVRGQATEIVLNGSTYSGEPIRISTDRRYLSRALALGFRELQLFDPRAPIQCRDTQRQYVWALLDPDSAVPRRQRGSHRIGPVPQPIVPPDSPTFTPEDRHVCNETERPSGTKPAAEQVSNHEPVAKPVGT